MVSGRGRGLEALFLFTWIFNVRTSEATKEWVVETCSFELLAVAIMEAVFTSLRANRYQVRL